MAPDLTLSVRPAAGRELIADDIGSYLEAHRTKDLLRFITCGSVDDGKSTLIGRLLYESKSLFEDQIAALEADSRRLGTQGGALDFALLVDGLAAEREQGITIDVAYRFFATEHRKFIVADTPGHEQYTRNMITGASTADVAVILVDARKGILTQTRRHSFLVSLIGIRQVVLAVNKMDLVGWSQAVFERIVAEYREFAAPLGFSAILPIPLSALSGDNVVEAGGRMPWYGGASLLRTLETVPAAAAVTGTHEPFRLPVQWVSRPHADFRGFAGLVASGTVRPGDPVAVYPAGRRSRVGRIVTADGDREQAVAGQSVTLTLEDEIDVSRGDLLAPPDDPPGVADRFEATLVWMAEEALAPGRPYLLKLGTRTVTATVDSVRHGIDVNSGTLRPAATLELNGIGLCELSLDHPVAFDPYARNRTTGGFILIDRFSNDTVGVGLLRAPLGRTAHVRWQAHDVTREGRAALKGQRPCVLWFTGLSGAGKSTIANLVERKLHADGRHTFLLDGDNLRHGLSRDLGFGAADRTENIRRVAEVAKLMADAGLIVLVSLISPFRADRRMARELLPPGDFLEVFVDTPLEVAEGRDVKGLYRRARSGEIAQFTGIDSPYEAPESPDIRIDTQALSPEEAALEIVRRLERLGVTGEDPLTDGAAI